MEKVKHYIRLDDKGFIIKAFSDAFEKPAGADICVNEDGGRHFSKDVLRPDGLPALKYEHGEIAATTDDDFREELDLIELIREKERLEDGLRELQFKEWLDGSTDKNANRVREIDAILDAKK